MSQRLELKGRWLTLHIAWNVEDEILARLMEGIDLSGSEFQYKTIVLTRRLKSPGVLETMSEQLPEVRNAFTSLDDQLYRRLEHLGPDSWRVVSHSHNIYNGILIMSVLLQRS